MKTLLSIFLLLFLTNMLHAQKDEEQVRSYLKEKFPANTPPEKVWFFQCKYKPGKTWQYLVACINTIGQKPVTTLLFTERVQDSMLIIEPFHFVSVESFDHFNMDKSRDNIEEFYITTSRDSGNLDEKYTGIYSCKKGYIDTLLKFYSFEVKSLKPPYFIYQPGMVVEQEDLCKLTDINGDGKTEVANRVHRKTIGKEPGSDTYSFAYETDYAEYKFSKGRLVKIKSKATQSAEE